MLAGLVKTSFLHPFFGSKGYQLHPPMFHHKHGSFRGIEIEKIVVFRLGMVVDFFDLYTI
jgi:hypothetical protein